MTPEFAVLTSMITPAVLISACAALILSTSTRLGRVVDRVRALSDRFEEMAHKDPGEVVFFEERLELTFTQLDFLTTRARYLQRAMTTFYVALGLFVATSVSIGLVGAVVGNGNPSTSGSRSYSGWWARRCSSSGRCSWDSKRRSRFARYTARWTSSGSWGSITPPSQFAIGWCRDESGLRSSDNPAADPSSTEPLCVGRAAWRTLPARNDRAA